ncbi:MAG: hypothetical protein CL572_06055 [Alphaproteobacteria bacterium]|nr:hypothetical protein [Alphaproteobacteria bacterium]
MNKLLMQKKIEKKETKISWDQPSVMIDRKIRAFSPVPGAWTRIKSHDKRIKIFKSKIILDNNFSGNSNKCGFVTDNLTVKCGKGSLQIIELQPEGKGKMNANDFLNGFKKRDFFFE